MRRLQILETPQKVKHKKGFVLHVSGYHGDLDYKVNETYCLQPEGVEDEEWLALSYLGYMAMKDRNRDQRSTEIVYEAMGGHEVTNKYGFDWPINPYCQYGEAMMRVEECSLTYHDGKGNINEVQVV